MIVTASPVLTNEIRRFYTSLKTKVIGELKKREEKRKLKQAISSLSEDQQIEAALQESKKDSGAMLADNLEEAEGDIEDEEKEEQFDEDEILDFEEMEKNMKMAQSMSDMRNEDFPAFLTIKRLVYMIDASVRRPFFARNIKNEIIGLES